MPRLPVFASVLSAALLSAVAALAQDYPVGACVLPGGQWCIPSTLGLPGSECSCLTSSGWQIGVQY